MNTVTVSTGVPIQLGYQYDDYATEVVFPSSIIEPFTDTYGTGGTFAIWYRRSGDATGYPIGSPLVVYDGTDVTWTVVETDVANPGIAQVQLRYIKDEHCVMSQMFSAVVEDSVDIGTEIPEPMEQWADAIIKAGSGGQPTAVTSSSAMTSQTTIYLYMGSEGGYQYGHIYYYDGTSWEDGGAYGSNTSGSGLTEEVKQALLACFENVAWKLPENPGGPTGADYYDALESALYPPVNLDRITAFYAQSDTVYDTDTLDSLRSGLLVTAYYDNDTSEVVTTYTLSGTLTEGTSTITVSYVGKTTTFNVTVTRLEIRVFKGKGTSGTSIIDNANRALSEMIYVGDLDNIITQWDYSDVQDAIKFTNGSNAVETTTYSQIPLQYIGTTTSLSGMGGADAYRKFTSELALANKPSNGVWEYIMPNSGYIRFLFRNVADASTAIGTISGIMYINGKQYHLVEKNASEFE